MRFRKAKAENGEADHQRTWDNPIPVVKHDLLMEAMVPCLECGAWNRAELLYKWDYRRSLHLSPEMGRRVHSEHGVTVVEGVDTRGPLCGSCFVEASDAVVKAALKAAEEEKKAQKASLKKRLSMLTKRQKQEQKAVEKEIAETEAALADKEVA